MEVHSQYCKLYQVAKCWKTGIEFPACNGDCSKCGTDEYTGVPKLSEIESLYKEYAQHTTTIRPVSVKANLSAWRKFITLTPGLNPNLLITQITSQSFSDFAITARNNGYADASIESSIEKIHNIFSKNACNYWKTIGVRVSALPAYTFKSRIERWVSLTRTARNRLREYEMELCDLSDPRKALCMIAAWERGMRKQDVLRQSWSRNFIERDGYIWWDYTANKNGKLSSWPVDTDTWIILQKLHRKFTNIHVQKLSAYSDSYLRVRPFTKNEIATSEIWDEVSKDLRQLMGWNGAKSMHNLRKDATDQVYQNLGIDAACEFSGDTEKMVRDHYSGRKQIDPRTISIAKM